MNSKKVRNLAFTLHRYIGLAVGLVLIVVGLTGSLLIFSGEISEFLDARQFGQVIPQEQRLPPDKILDIAKAAHPNWKITQFALPKDDHHFYYVKMESLQAKPKVYLDGQYEIYVNPYTGVIFNRPERHTYYRFLLNLHYRLFAEDLGIIITGIAALLLLILSITGLILWPGWRKLIAGFKIKWKAHAKRVNFDIHKVVGMITTVFLVSTAFTGFCWNFPDFTYPIIYAVTFSSPKAEPEPVSQVIANQVPLKLTEILQIADAALPGAKTEFIYLPEKPNGIFSVYKTFPQLSEAQDWSYVYLDQYTGKVLKVQNASDASLSLGDKILGSFGTLHYGTFGGLPTRILYVFVGLAPLILFITGFVMWS